MKDQGHSSVLSPPAFVRGPKGTLFRSLLNIFIVFKMIKKKNLFYSQMKLLNYTHTVSNMLSVLCGCQLLEGFLWDCPILPSKNRRKKLFIFYWLVKINYKVYSSVPYGKKLWSWRNEFLPSIIFIHILMVVSEGVATLVYDI